MFRNWKLRKVSVRLLGLSADFERAQTALEDRDDASAAAFELKEGIEAVKESLLILEEVAEETDDEDDFDFIDNQLDETESWVDGASQLAEEIGEADEYAGADLLEQLADIYKRMAAICEILAEKFE